MFLIVEFLFYFAIPLLSSSLPPSQVLELMNQLNLDAENEVKQAQKLIDDLKGKKANRAKKLKDLVTMHAEDGRRKQTVVLCLWTVMS